MKLIRFGDLNYEKPGILTDDGRRFDVSDFLSEYDENFFGRDGIEKLKEWFLKNKNSCQEVESNVRWGSPLSRPSKIVCVGLNYAKHAKESGMESPKEPVLFFKSSSAIIGPYDPIIISKEVKTDWEVELAVVIGKEASYISKIEALSHIAGYILHNDVSEGPSSERSGQWLGKSCDTFAPLG